MEREGKGGEGKGRANRTNLLNLSFRRFFSPSYTRASLWWSSMNVIQVT